MKRARTGSWAAFTSCRRAPGSDSRLLEKNNQEAIPGARLLSETQAGQTPETSPGREEDKHPAKPSAKKKATVRIASRKATDTCTKKTETACLLCSTVFRRPPEHPDADWGKEIYLQPGDFYLRARRIHGARRPLLLLPQVTEKEKKDTGNDGWRWTGKRKKVSGSSRTREDDLVRVSTTEVTDLRPRARRHDQIKRPCKSTEAERKAGKKALRYGAVS